MSQQETEHVPNIPTPTALINPSLVGHIFQVPSISNDSDTFSTNLAAGVFDPKLTVEDIQLEVVVPKVEFPSSNRRDCGRACKARPVTVEWISRFPGLYETGPV